MNNRHPTTLTRTRFHIVATVIAKRDRLYHPEMYRKGDKLIVGLYQSATGHWLVRALNDRGQSVNGLVNTSYKNKSYARKRAKEFAQHLAA